MSAKKPTAQERFYLDKKKDGSLNKAGERKRKLKPRGKNKQ